VGVDDDEAHQRIVDGLLGARAPCDLGAGIVGEGSHEFDLREIAELDVLDIGEFAADHEVQKLVRHAALSKLEPVGRLERPPPG
jgi:hypothetical protein